MVGLVGVKDTVRNFINWGLVDFLTNGKFSKLRLVKRYCLIIKCYAKYDELSI